MGDETEELEERERGGGEREVGGWVAATEGKETSLEKEISVGGVLLLPSLLVVLNETPTSPTQLPTLPYCGITTTTSEY